MLNTKSLLFISGCIAFPLCLQAMPNKSAKPEWIKCPGAQEIHSKMIASSVPNVKRYSWQSDAMKLNWQAEAQFKPTQMVSTPALLISKKSKKNKEVWLSCWYHSKKDLAQTAMLMARLSPNMSCQFPAKTKTMLAMDANGLMGKECQSHVGQSCQLQCRKNGSSHVA